MKKFLLINVVICLSTNNAVAMCFNTDFKENQNEQASYFLKPLKTWNHLPVTVDRETRIYNKLWNPNYSKERNTSELVDTFLDHCCDFSFRIHKTTMEFTYGSSGSNNNILFIKNATGLRLVKSYPNRFTNFNLLNNVGKPVEFTNTIKEQIKHYIRFIAQDSVGYELLRVAIAKTKVNHLNKIIFVPLTKDSNALKCDKMTCYYGVYGNQLEDIQSLLQNHNLPVYRYILFSPEQLTSPEYVLVARYKYSNSNTLDFCKAELPIDVVLFNKINTSLHYNSTKCKDNIKARLNVMQRKLSKSIIKKFDDLIDIEVQADFFISTSHQWSSYNTFRQILGLGSLHQYTSQVVTNMSNKERLTRIEEKVSSGFKNDEEFRTMYGITRQGLDPLSESAYFAHRYNKLRVSFIKESDPFYDVHIEYIKNYGDMDLYTYYLSQNQKPAKGKEPISAYSLKAKECDTSLSIPGFMLHAIANNMRDARDLGTSQAK